MKGTGHSESCGPLMLWLLSEVTCVAATSMVGEWSSQTFFQGNNKGQTSKKLTALVQGLLPEDLERRPSESPGAPHWSISAPVSDFSRGLGRFPRASHFTQRTKYETNHKWPQTAGQAPTCQCPVVCGLGRIWASIKQKWTVFRSHGLIYWTGNKPWEGNGPVPNDLTINTALL